MSFRQARFSLRRGTDVTVEAGATRLRLLSIHLNSGCREEALGSSQQCTSLAQQSEILAGWVAERRRDGMPFAILGDFMLQAPRASAQVVDAPSRGNGT